MPRNDGINRTTVRNANLTDAQITNTQRHNEREKESYTNPDIVPARTPFNIHFKTPDAGYKTVFEQMEKEKIISTRGLKDDACHFGELIFDVNSAYFDNNGGYEFAKKYYAEAYKAAIKIVGGEQYILSAVMHADERNSSMSGALGRDVFHYHMHVVYIPVVEKQVLWTKRCKDPALVGTVKETIMQVSSSKKWISRPAVDVNGKPVLSRNGKPILKKSYSLLQDDYFDHMRSAGFTDIERGERGSTEEHLTVTQFKVQKEQEKLTEIAAQIEAKGKKLSRLEKKTTLQIKTSASFTDIESMGETNRKGQLVLSESEAYELKSLAKEGVRSRGIIADLKKKLASAKRDIENFKTRYEKLYEETKDFIAAAARSPELVKEFIFGVISKPLGQERSRIQINYRKER